MADDKTTIGRRVMVSYDPGIALKVCEYIAEGKTLREALKEPGTPSINTWYKWLMLYPDLEKAYEAARTLSAQSFEDELLSIASKLKDERYMVTDLMLKRFQAAMQQLRWSAERRDPKHFGERKEASIVVPIQINTSLDLNSLGGQSTSEYANVYELKAAVQETPTDGDGTADDIPLLDDAPEARVDSPLFDLPEADEKPLLKRQVGRQPGVAQHRRKARPKPAPKPQTGPTGKNIGAINRQRNRLARKAAQNGTDTGTYDGNGLKAGWPTGDQD